MIGNALLESVRCETAPLALRGCYFGEPTEVGEGVHMGAALFVVLNRHIEGLDTFVDGKALARSETVLSRACEEVERA